MTKKGAKMELNNLLLSDKEIDKLIGSKTSERYLARHCTYQEAQILIKAQLAKCEQHYNTFLAADKSTGDALDKSIRQQAFKEVGEKLKVILLNKKGLYAIKPITDLVADYLLKGHLPKE